MPLLTDPASAAGARRIVSLVPSLTETVAELGASERLAGVTDWCWYPAAVVAPLAKVGGTKNPKLEAIRALKPDLILVNEEENRQEDVEALAADFNCYVTFPKHAGDNIALITALGEILGREAAAAACCEQITMLEGQVRSQMLARPPRSIAYLIWRKPWMTINGDTYVHDVLTFLNCTNPWADHSERYPSLPPADLIAADPELICLSSEPFPFEERHLAEFRTAFPALQATRSHQVFIDDGTYYCWYGTRWLRALQHFATNARWFL